MTDEDRQYNGRVIEELCRLSDAIVKEFVTPPEPPSIPETFGGMSRERYREIERIHFDSRMHADDR